MSKTDEKNYSTNSSTSGSDLSSSDKLVGKLISNVFRTSNTSTNFNKTFITLQSSNSDVESTPIKTSTPVNDSKSLEMKINDNLKETQLIPDTSLLAAKLKPQINNTHFSNTIPSTNNIITEVQVQKNPPSIINNQTSESSIRPPIIINQTSTASTVHLNTTNLCEGEIHSSNTSNSTKGPNLSDSNLTRRSSGSSRIPISIRRIHSQSKIQLQLISQPQNNFHRSSSQYNCNTFSTQPPYHHRLSNSNCDKYPLRRDEKPPSGKFSHVKSKLAAYIHRPTKSELNKDEHFISRRTDMKKTDIYSSYPSILKRSSSRLSIDTYTCDFKTPAPDIECIDYEKFTNESNELCNRIRRHFELAVEHSKMRIEKDKVIAMEQQSAIEHSEKANDCMQKCIALLLNKLSEKS